MNSLYFILLCALTYFNISQSHVIYGPLQRPCDLNHYPSVCKSELINNCYDCYHNHLFQQECVPVFEDVLKELEKYPRNDWNCTIHEPINREYTFQDTKDIIYTGKVYHACEGSICMRGGWMNYIKHNNNYWCGLGRCFKTHKSVVCDRPQHCDGDL